MRAATMIPPSCLETLQTLVAANCQGPPLETPRLEGFYRYCLRQPAVRNHRRLSPPMNTLLYRYAFLRPELQMSLADWICTQWQTFAANVPAAAEGIPAEDDRFPVHAPPETDASPAFAPAPASPSAPKSVPRLRPADWFERFLDAVRILLFL